MNKAMDYYLKGFSLYMRFTKKANEEARKAYKEAIKEDANLHRARADLAYSMLHAWLFGWDTGVKLEDAQKELAPALESDPEDYYNRWVEAALHLYLKDIDFDAIDKAYNDAFALAGPQAIDADLQAFRVDRAEMWLLTDRATDAIDEIDKAIAETPVPEKWFYWVLALAQYEAGKWQKSLKTMEEKIVHPRNAMRKVIIADLEALGQHDDAVEQAKQYLLDEKSQEITFGPPGTFIVEAVIKNEDRTPYKDSERLEAWKKHLRSAFKDLKQP